MNNLFYLLIVFFQASFGNTTTPNHDINIVIDNALKYFNNNKDADLATMYNFNYLARKFDLPDLYPVPFIMNKLQKDKGLSVKNYELMARLIDKNYNISIDELKMGFDNSIGELMLQAVYCDIFPIDKQKIFDKLFIFSDSSGYQLTHALLVLQWLEENNCMNDEETIKLKQKTALNIFNMINHTNELNDLTIEGIAFLLYSDFRNFVKQEWMDNLIELQQQDGGWTWDNNEEISNLHTSVLSLWAILEWYYPQQNEPFIK